MKNTKQNPQEQKDHSQQQQKNQQQKTRQIPAPVKQSLDVTMIHEVEIQFDQEHPETRLTR